MPSRSLSLATLLPFGQCLLLLLFLGLTCTPVQAQSDDQTTSELLENFFRDNEQASESDAQMFLENLDNYRNRPLDLNRASREDLLGLHLLNEIQVENLIAYRGQLGGLLNIYELQAVPGWDLDDIRRMLLFSKVSDALDTRNTRIINGFYEGENELLVRWGRPVPAPYPATAEGGRNAWGLRFRHSFDNRLRFGFTAENDPGEAFFAKSNQQGFDFYSAHLFAQNVNRTVRTLALGDYSARWGQGLLLQTGFSPGKSAETTAVTRSGRKLNAYGAFGEAYFFRGAAATLGFGKHLEITALYSDRRRDANIDTTDLEFPEIIFSSLQTAGLHRTASEITNEKSLHEQIGGLSATYGWRSGQLSLNGLHIQYDKPWNPKPAAYRRYAFNGQSLTGTSIDYNWRRRNWYFFGETARSDQGGMASLNGLLLSPDPHVTLTAVHRSLGKDYQSIYANPFAEVTGASNERGLFLGADIRYIRRWQVNVYADVWEHPWLRFGVSAPSRGREFLARVLWTKSKTFSTYLLWQSETKERDTDLEGRIGLVESRRDRLRLHAIYKVSPGLELRSRVEWTTVHADDQGKSKGFMAYQEAVVKSLGFPLSGTVRYSIFDTDTYDTRAYAFENDLFSAISIPTLSGRGSRYYFNLLWRVNRWLRLEARVEQTNQVKAVTSTGTTGKERFFKLQARVRM